MKRRLMTRQLQTILILVGVLTLTTGAVTAFVHDQDGASPLADKEFVAPALAATPMNTQVSDLPQKLAGGSRLELERLGAETESAILDRRGGRWRTLMTSLPLIPGIGAGNDLQWDQLGVKAVDDNSIATVAWDRLRSFLESNSESLRIDVSELDHRVAVHDGGALIQIWADRKSGGLPVHGAGFSAVINNGNLVLAGAERWADIDLERRPFISAEQAIERVTDFIFPMTVDSVRAKPTLAILPASVDGAFSVGQGYVHHLAWVVLLNVIDDIGQWQAMVDAHNGEILALQDVNHYSHERRAKGGVYPESYDGNPPDGNMVSGYPMPHTDLSTGGFTDAGGNFLGLGSQTTTLSGQFVNVQDFCNGGTISETATSGDIDLGGTHGDIDCTVPPGASPGNTAAARTTFYETNRINEIARGQLPSNPWLNGQLTTQTNIGIPICNAFWTGTVTQFYRELFPCANTGQVAGVIDHEWGHGMDDNDVVGTIPSVLQGGGEGMADVYAALRGDVACIGRGFFISGALCGGYGDPCTAASGCTGIRTVDFADRVSGLPHTLTWVRNNCGFTSHCMGAAYSETVWDLLKRDLPTIYGMSNNTALELTNRLTFIGAGNSTGWFDLQGPPPGGAACGASQAYLQFLAADDDDGNLANGTPHMTAIASAFGRHEIDCTPAFGGPTVQDNGCAGTPTTAPTVNMVATTFGADLSWGAVPGANSYEIFRTDGEHQCDYGKVRVGRTAGTSFSDSGLQKGRDYYYTVIPKGPRGSCFGPASPCTTRQGSDYVMSAPFPGPAGVTNTFTASNGTPGATTFFIYGTTTGNVPIPGCGGAALGIDPFFLLGSAIADASGVAEFNFPVPGTAAGLTVLLQAIELTSCEVSNVVTHTF